MESVSRCEQASVREAWKRGGEAGTCDLMDPTCMCTTNQAAKRGVSQPVRANKRARGRKKRRGGRHVQTNGSHMHVHNQPGGGAWSQSAGASKQASERQEEEEGKLARAY